MCGDNCTGNKAAAAARGAYLAAHDSTRLGLEGVIAGKKRPQSGEDDKHHTEQDAGLREDVWQVQDSNADDEVDGQRKDRETGQ